jgi:hypothetical protein
MNKKRTIIIVSICLLFVVCIAAYAFSEDSIFEKLGQSYKVASNDGNQEVAAEYNGEKILMSTVTYEKNTSFLRNETGRAGRANDREIVDRIIENMILFEEAEKLGLSATQIEIDDMVEMTKKAYDLPEGKKMMDEFFTTAEITLDEYLGIIREQAPRVIARQKLRDMIAQEYCEEHGIEFTKVNQPDDMVEAVNTYIAKLLETHKGDIVYYID